MKQLKRYGCLATVARMLGVPSSTLDSAVRGGKVKSAELGCGRLVVDIKDAERWRDSERKRGPKPG